MSQKKRGRPLGREKKGGDGGVREGKVKAIVYETMDRRAKNDTYLNVVLEKRISRDVQMRRW